ncbi:MAG: hypothetical protein ACRD22_15610 [Terriglobia bacterium]
MKAQKLAQPLPGDKVLGQAYLSFGLKSGSVVTMTLGTVMEIRGDRLQVLWIGPNKPRTWILTRRFKFRYSRHNTIWWKVKR